MNFFVNGGMGISNSGIEHAEFYRAKLFAQLGEPYKYVFVDFVPKLQEAMKAWHIAPDAVANIWEYFTLGDQYLRDGVTREFSAKDDLVIDSTQTHRKKETWTTGGLRIVEHLVKHPDRHKKTDILLVSTAHMDIFSRIDGKRKVTFEYVDDPHRKTMIRNIHVFDLNGEHLFFANEVPARRFFFNRLAQTYGGHSNFIIDRGERNEAALFSPKMPHTSIIDPIHADHLSNRDDPAKPLWNNYYEYLLTHLDKVDKVVVATQLQRQDLLVDFPKQTDKFVVIPVGGVRDQPTIDLTKPLGKPVKLITASRLAAEKNINLIIRAVAAVHDEGIPIELAVYGEGGQQADLEKEVKKLHAADYIKLAGQSTHLEDLYPQYDAFVSGSFSEGFGLTFIEALNAALPVIAFDARFGAQELIDDGVNGFLQPFKRGDEAYNVDQLKIAIHRLLDANYAQLRKNTQQSVKQYQDHVNAEKWKVLIDELRVD